MEAGITGSLSSVKENFLSTVIGYITFALDVAAAFIIAAAAVVALIDYVKGLLSGQKSEKTTTENIRYQLARGLLLALDFEVGSDLLKSILVPTITELIILTVVVALRVVLGWSLSRETHNHSKDAAA